MPNVRILMWNIRFFSQSVVNEQNRLNRIINRVHPSAGPLADIFIIIEPNKFSHPTHVGQLVAGSSIKGLQTVFYALQHRNAAWRMVPPRALTTSSTSGAYGFHGPASADDAIPTPRTISEMR